jgi:hypothetical protein
MLVRRCLARVATRTMKNSSRLFAAIAGNFTRSSAGGASDFAYDRTRSLKASQLSSQLMYNEDPRDPARRS